MAVVDFSLERAAFSVLWRNKRLFFFPVLSFLAMLATLVLLARPVVDQMVREEEVALDCREPGAHIHPGLFCDQVASADYIPDQRGYHQVELTYKTCLYFGFAVFCLAFISTCFKVAFYHELMDGLRGREVTISDGFNASFDRLALIFAHAATLGVGAAIVTTLFRDGRRLARWSGYSLTFALNFATMFAVPVIVTAKDRPGPLEVLRRAGRTNWTVSTGGTAAPSDRWSPSLLALVAVTILVFSVGGGLSLIQEDTLPIATAFSVYIGGCVVIPFILNFLSDVSICALFLAADGGAVPASYTPDLLRRAIHDRQTSQI